MSDTQHHGGIGLTGLLFLLFLGLRLTDNIDWAWYWVAAPLWMPVAIAIPIAIIWVLVAGDKATTQSASLRALLK